MWLFTFRIAHICAGNCIIVFALSGSQKYEYRIPIRCYTATFDNVTAGTYAVWVQVDDTDTWVKVGDSITVGNTAGGDSDNTGNPTTE